MCVYTCAYMGACMHMCVCVYVRETDRQTDREESCGREVRETSFCSLEKGTQEKGSLTIAEPENGQACRVSGA